MPYLVVEYDKNEFVCEGQGSDITRPVYSYKIDFDVSRQANLNISVYQRSNNKTPSATVAHPVKIPFVSKNTIEKTIDTFVVDYGNTVPNLKNEDVAVRLQQGGELKIRLEFKAMSKKMTIDDFDLLKVIGKGSFGKVMQVRKKDSNRIYALKIIRKANIIQRDEVEHTLAERTVLSKLNNPFIVNLKFSFQSPDKLYLVLAFVNGGELFHHLQTEGCFNEARAKFYIAELISALDTLHGLNIIYRDLKPENILLDYTGHIALCDFGLCKLNMTKDETTNTFCGTPEYLAPELLLGNGYTKVVDWWTLGSKLFILGVLLYEMMIGLPPFYSENTNEMYRKILSDPLRFPDENSGGVRLSPETKDLLIKLLERDEKKRLGANGAAEIRKHPFFNGIDWVKLERKQLTPPFRPNVLSASDTSNFSEEFTSEPATDSLIEGAPMLSNSVQDQFKGFTYIGNENNAMYGSSLAQTQRNKGI